MPDQPTSEPPTSTPECPRCGTAMAPPQVNSSDAAGVNEDADATGDAGSLQCPKCLLRPPWDKPHPVAITLGPGQSFVPPTVEELATHITGYDIHARIGQGGMGAVYRGRQQSLDRPVAIKILPPQIAEREGFRQRFAQEARALAKLNHPNIVAVYDYGQAGPYAMLVMELVEGANLREVLAQGRLSPTEAMEIIPQLCDALSYAHEEGVVHRDIKPENLLFDGRGRLKITDFGLAKLLAPKNKSDNQNEPDSSIDMPDPTRGVIGTIHYMAPEQLESPGNVDHRADIYAMGVVFYEMLTGELPIGRFDPPSERVTATNVKTDTNADCDSIQIDVRLDEVVLRALQKQPEKRYSSASALMDAIDSPDPASPTANVLEGDDEQAIKQEIHERLRKTFHRTRVTMEQVAALSYEASGSALTSAQNRFFSTPRLQLPSYLGILLLVSGIGLSLLIENQPGGDATAMFVFFASTLIGWVLLRISLARENDNEPKLISTRIGLGYIALLFVLPILFLPGILTFAGWLEFHGTPRGPGDTYWLLDWSYIASCIAVTSSITWLLLLISHAAFPRVLTFVFKPLIHPWSVGRILFGAVVLVGLLATASFAITRLGYLPYERGDVRDQPRSGMYSPRDDQRYQKDLRMFDTKQKRDREISSSESP